MMRGTFANIRIRNEMTPEQVGGVTRYIPTGEVMPIYDASMLYQKNHHDLVVISGKVIVGVAEEIDEITGAGLAG